MNEYQVRIELEKVLIDALKAVVTGTTNIIGQDSTGQDVRRIRDASFQKVLAALKTAGA